MGPLQLRIPRSSLHWMSETAINHRTYAQDWIAHATLQYPSSMYEPQPFSIGDNGELLEEGRTVCTAESSEIARV